MREKTIHLTITRNVKGYYSVCIDGKPTFQNCEDLRTAMSLVAEELEARQTDLDAFGRNLPD